MVLPDGSLRKIHPAITQYGPQYRHLLLTMQPLRPGVVVEFEEQFDAFRPDELVVGMWSQEPLGGVAPCRRFRLTVAVAAPFELNYRLHHGGEEPQCEKVGDYQVHTWDLADRPGVEIDVWTPPHRDFLPWVDLTTVGSWEPFARHFSRELEPPATLPPPVRQLLHELTDGLTDDRQKALAIYRYATGDVRYGRHPHELQLSASRSAEEMLQDLRGDCKDKSALIVALLRASGITANIVILQSRQHGTTPFLPAPWFDHAVVRAVIDGSEVWLDAAGGPFDFGRLPQLDQGVQALTLDGLDSSIGRTPEGQPADHYTRRVCRGAFDETGGYSFNAEVTLGGEAACDARLKYLHRSAESRRRSLESAVLANLAEAEAADVEFRELEKLDRPVVYGCSITLPHWGRRIQDLLLFRIPWLETARPAEPVSGKERRQPLTAPGPIQLHDRHEIRCPTGFRGYGLPFVAEQETPWGRFRIAMTAHDDQIICERQVELHGGIVQPADFPQFQKFWRAWIHSDEADLVLTRA